MEFDVCKTTRLTVIFCMIMCSTTSLSDDLQIVTRPFSLEENVYFEILEPEEISYTYKIRPAKDFGLSLNTTFFNLELMPTEPMQGCTEITNANDIIGSIAFIQRGGCSFLSKTLNAEMAGALMVIIYDHDPNNDSYMIDMIGDETGRNANIAAFFLQGRDGYMIQTTLHQLNLQSALITIPINGTGQSGIAYKQPPWTLW